MVEILFIKKKKKIVKNNIYISFSLIEVSVTGSGTLGVSYAI